MPADHPQWAVQYHLPDDLPDEGPWHCYVFVRCDAKAETGPGMQIGLYDSAAGKSIASVGTTIEESAGKEYKPFDLGVHKLGSSLYFWVAPSNNPDEVEAVYVDRVVLVRQPESE